MKNLMRAVICIRMRKKNFRGGEVMSNYRRGYVAELRALEELRNDGYVVVRTAGSRGPFDLVALREDSVRLVQIKRTKRKKIAPPVDLRAFEELPVPPGITKELWIWQDGRGFSRYVFTEDNGREKKCESR